MSFEAVFWALNDAPMLMTAAGKPDTTARLVLVARAERADKKGGNSYAGPVDVSRATGLDERTIQRAEIRLEKAGLMIREGFSHLNTTRWRLDLSLKESDGNHGLVEDRIDRRRKGTAERVRRFRERQKAESIDGDGVPQGDVTDSVSLRNVVERRDVTDSASRCNGHSAPQTSHEPPGVTTSGTTPGGTLPPDPLRHPAPSVRANDQQNSLSEPVTQQLALQRNSLPHASAEELAPVIDIRTWQAS